MREPTRFKPWLAGGAALTCLLLASCVPLFTDGDFQSLRLTFKLDKAVTAAEVKPVQTLLFPEAVKVAKRWVQLSGRLTSQGSGKLPRQVVVDAKVQKLQNGQTTQTLKFKLAIAADGTFEAAKKVKKNLAANDMVVVTMTPSGGSIAKNTEITLCVDLVKTKADLDGLPICIEGNPVEMGGDDTTATLSSIQSSIFTPTCAVSGCHSSGSASAGLVLTSGQSFSNLVNVASTQVPSFDRVEPNNANTSYLVKKLRGDGDISGARMPSGQPPLSNAQLNMIIQWIESGAPNN